MSSSTWTPAALSSEARPLSGTCWRLVEAQYRVSTLKLVDTVEEQCVLEDLIQGTKPVLPAGVRTPSLSSLHALSIRSGLSGGLAVQTGRVDGRRLLCGRRTAFGGCRDRLLSVALLCQICLARPGPRTPAEYTAFSAAYATKQGIDLTIGKLQRDKALWMHLMDYEPCQRLGDWRVRRTSRSFATCRCAIRGRASISPCSTGRVFTRPRPLSEQTWHIRLSDTGAQAICEAPKSGITFGRDAFAADPRIAKLRWKRP